VQENSKQLKSIKHILELLPSDIVRSEADIKALTLPAPEKPPIIYLEPEKTDRLLYNFYTYIIRTRNGMLAYLRSEHIGEDVYQYYIRKGKPRKGHIISDGSL